VPNKKEIEKEKEVDAEELNISDLVAASLPLAEGEKEAPKLVVTIPHRYIYLSTIQSTGTWWAIKALRSHPDIGGIVHVQNLISMQNGWELRGGWEGNPHNESLATNGKITMLYSHYGGLPKNREFVKWKPRNNYENIMMVVPTLAPLRDPLTCMIRAVHRDPSLYPHDFLIEGWLHVAKRDDTLGVKYWCMEPFDHKAFITAVYAVGLTCPDEWVNTIAFRERVNTTHGQIDLRQFYLQKDYEAIKLRIPEICQRLEENEPILRPFLEKHGFKDLLWWS
jgi:hypothetical protein